MWCSTVRPTRDVELPRYALTLRCEGVVPELRGEDEPRHDVAASHLLVAAWTILRATYALGEELAGRARNQILMM